MSTLTVYQNFYDPAQRGYLDPAFVPRDGTDNPWPELREVGVFRSLHGAGALGGDGLTGVVSHKFGRKTKLSGAEFLAFIRANPGHDVYFVNPFPQNAYFTFNVWEQGDACHPGPKAAAQELFRAAGLAWDVRDFPRNDWRTLAYCNFFVGSAKFWRIYIGLVDRLLDSIDEMPADRRAIYFADTRHIAPTPMLPFIFERLFSTLLVMNGALSACAYRHSPQQIIDACVFPGERAIYETSHPFIDAWDAEGRYTSERRQMMHALDALNGIVARLQIEAHGLPEDLL